MYWLKKAIRGMKPDLKNEIFGIMLYIKPKHLNKILNISKVRHNFKT